MDKGFHEAMLTQEVKEEGEPLGSCRLSLFAWGGITNRPPTNDVFKNQKNKSAGGIKCLHCDEAIRKNAKLLH